ncbi:MAG: hypothetical protein LKK19_05955 [Bacteroidales bacterium]|jgi:cell division protein FtsQ|nr:hypothetical protein [Bacteroidales bacterium]MCI2122230.1 hypothetical protein [Bacteroidales bacterium]MCI2145566.1 hypothetical protein [Bacteroidales bacterium]
MVRRILTYVLMAIATVLLGAYFYFTTKLERESAAKRICKSIEVVIADSTENRFVHKDEIINTVQETFKVRGRKLYDVNCGAIETLLNTTSAIRSSEAYVTDDGILHITVRQHRPVARIQTSGLGFYIDRTGWIFPLQDDYSSYVTIITGYIPIKVDKYTRGYLKGRDKKWMDNLLPFANFIADSNFWSAQIEQVEIAPDGNVIIFPRIGKQTIVFGGFDRYADKFGKLDAFYKAVIPEKGWNKYSEVNLKYKNQIICK